MRTNYISALAPAKGAEGELQKFRERVSKTSAWYSPLPLIIPIHTFDAPFPRDRVNPSGLRLLPPLSLEGPVVENDNIILEFKGVEALYDSQTYLRVIHEKQIPPVSKTQFSDWKGLLLNPCGLHFPETSVPGEVESVSFQFRSWQMGLYKIRFDENRRWWEDFKCTCLWQVRKPSD
jgi:hypothetical protein